MKTSTVPLPPELKHLSDEETRPRHIGSSDVARLLEFWGFASNGLQHLKKLVGCGALTPRRIEHQRNLRFCVGALMEYYHKAIGET